MTEYMGTGNVSENRIGTPLGHLNVQGQRQVRAGSTCIIMRGLADSRWDRDLHLVNNWLLNHGLLEDRLLEDRLLIDWGALQINIGTHRGHIESLSLVMTRMVGMDIRSIGGVGHLRLEVDARVGRVDVAGHGDGCGNESRLTKGRNDARSSGRIRLAGVCDEVGRMLTVVVVVGLIEGSSVVNEDLLTSSGDWRGVVVRRDSGKSWVVQVVVVGLRGRVLLGLLTRILGRGTFSRGGSGSRGWTVKTVIVTVDA